ncbi:YchJ family protein [Pseudokineococcus sp. 1T1Z-3]|uniref:YchJ family protein n=1 Tax=Pseudokineococcus sp. 1T1Z-3 TaxID=3132745 RepID=UPI0030A7FF79
MSVAAPREARCPCGWGEPYERCCGRLHRQQAQAPTAEALMRSRYSAFAVGDVEHLVRTWHPATRPQGLAEDLAVEVGAGGVRWLHLAVTAVEEGGPFDDAGFVTFEAVSRAGGRRHVLRERSAFARVDGRWAYVAAVGATP